MEENKTNVTETKQEDKGLSQIQPNEKRSWWSIAFIWVGTMLCTSFPFRDENKKEELPRILLIHDSSSYARHPIRARVLVLRRSPVPVQALSCHRAGDTAIAAR